MKSVYYSGLARAALIARSGSISPLRRSVGRVPLLRNIMRLGKRWAAKTLLARKPSWVKVESGLAQGMWLRLKLDEESVYWLGTYEVRVQDMLRKLCGPESIFYDIGANLGFFSFAIAKSIGPNGKVFAFEPEPENCLRFKEMAVRNNLQSRLELVEAAVWSYTSSTGVPFKRGRRPRAHGGISSDGVTPVLAEGETRLVSTISLDDFLRKRNPAPHVLKIDVEGGECEVLKGGEELFSQARPAIVCEVHAERASQWITEWLAAKGYAAEWYVPGEGFPRLLLARPV